MASGSRPYAAAPYEKLGEVQEGACSPCTALDFVSKTGAKQIVTSIHWLSLVAASELFEINILGPEASIRRVAGSIPDDKSPLQHSRQC